MTEGADTGDTRNEKVGTGIVAIAAARVRLLRYTRDPNRMRAGFRSACTPYAITGPGDSGQSCISAKANLAPGGSCLATSRGQGR